MPRKPDSEVIHFIRWVREQLNKRGIAFASSLRIRLEPKPGDTQHEIEVPPCKRWENLLNQESWNLFVEKVLSNNLPACWILRDSNLVVKAEGVEQGQYVSASFPALGVPEQATDNLIYRTIGKKSEQAQKWNRAGGNYQPLVLVIGASKGLHRMNAENQFSLRQLEKAVYSALADVKRWSWTNVLNLTDNRSFPDKLYSQQVDGSELLSAVVIVTIRNELEGWNRWTERASRPIIIKNPHLKIALTAEQEQFLARLDFNHVEYELS
ncbi:hypothetical protein LEP3755_64880 (plasmid) [Leptolyngbya sp. NIES-3755]|nr:hypothetical protein LEP3755_64880 [Leptolyngbya sp. NIES-3755]